MKKALLIVLFAGSICSLVGQVAPPSRPKTPAKDPDTTPMIKPKAGLKEVEKEIKLGEDEPGCKDLEVLPRIPGCSIIQCDNKPDANDVDVQIGATTDGSPQTEAMDGSADIIYYLCPARITTAQVPKLAEVTLVKSGYKVVYAGKDGDDFPIVTLLKDNQWVQVSTYLYNEHTAYILTALKVPAENGASAEALADEMNKAGKIVLTDNLFENSSNDDLTPDAEKTLSSIAAVIVRQPEWRVRIEAHLSTVDAKTKNELIDLSQKRASAVAQWLMEHGIDKSRVTIQGLGDSKPLAGNSSPDDQAKNRRVEIVRF